jgi:hypothetical protein
VIIGIVPVTVGIICAVRQIPRRLDDYSTARYGTPPRAVFTGPGPLVGGDGAAIESYYHQGCDE